MENQLPPEKQPNQIVKKEWITPEMQEMSINGGAAYAVPETSGNGS